MYRTNAQSRVLEEAFIRYGMPYKLVAGTRFYERREVKDIIAYLRLIQNPFDSVSLLRIINVPQRGIGQQSLDELTRWAGSMGGGEYDALKLLAESKDNQRRASLHRADGQGADGLRGDAREVIRKSSELNTVELFDLLVEKIGYKKYIDAMPDGEERWENVLELRAVAQEYRDLSPRGGPDRFPRRRGAGLGRRYA